MNSDGSNQTSLQQPGEEPAWSPDGTKIAFASIQADPEIHVMDADGSHVRAVTNNPGNDHWPPTWSPDGRRLAFTCESLQDEGEICVTNVDGSGLRNLTRNDAQDQFPAWQPKP